jgi:hypothetical protein
VLYAADGTSGADMAKDADVAIVFVSTSSSEGADRHSLNFGGGDDMVAQVRPEMVIETRPPLTHSPPDPPVCRLLP